MGGGPAKGKIPALPRVAALNITALRVTLE